MNIQSYAKAVSYHAAIQAFGRPTDSEPATYYDLWVCEHDHGTDLTALFACADAELARRFPERPEHG